MELPLVFISVDLNRLRYIFFILRASHSCYKKSSIFAHFDKEITQDNLNHKISACTYFKENDQEIFTSELVAFDKIS